jgi:hypothetical protein
VEGNFVSLGCGVLAGEGDGDTDVDADAEEVLVVDDDDEVDMGADVVDEFEEGACEGRGG